MIYFLFIPLIKLGLRLYFRKIFLLDIDRVPKDKKLLFVINHPTSFIDPIFLPALTPFVFNFLIRADVFKGTVVKALLRGIHGIPIAKNGRSKAGAKINSATFETVVDTIYNVGPVMILAEGSTKYQKKMRPLKKGFGHILFQYYDKYKSDDIWIQPCSFTYIDVMHMRNNVYAQFGNPIPLSDYTNSFEGSRKEAVNAIVDRTFEEMKSSMVHIEQVGDTQLVDRFIEMIENKRAYFFLKALIKEGSQFTQIKSMNRRINDMGIEDKNALKETQDNYFSRLKSLGVSDLGLVQKQRGQTWKLFLWMILLPLSFVGKVATFMPMKLAYHLASKVAKKVEFISAIRVGLIILFNPLFVFLFFCLTWIFTSLWSAFLLTGLVVLLGYIHIYTKSQFSIWKEARQFNKLEKHLRQDLEKDRNQLLAQLEHPALVSTL